MSRVLIVLVNWNGWRDTLECLESLLLLEYTNFRLVVCDNGSIDDSLQRIKLWGELNSLSYMEYSREQAESGGDSSADPLLTVIRNNENLGFAGGNNVGFRYGMARGDVDFYWLLNNDTVVEPDALGHMVSRIESQSLLGICGSTLRLYHDRARTQALGGGYYCHWIGLPWHYGRFSQCIKTIDASKAETWMNYVEGASMLVSRKFLDEVGLLCEDYFLYFEEADWAIRAKGRFNLVYAPQSIVYHKVGRSIGTNSNPACKSFICDYYNIRNRLLFTRRFYPAALLPVSFVIFIELLLRLFLGKWDRVAMISKLLFNAARGNFGVSSDHRMDA